jgi:hypothetical protein
MALKGEKWPGYAEGTIPDEGFEWRFIDATPADIDNRDPPCVYIPFGYSQSVLPKGWKKTPEKKALDLDIRTQDRSPPKTEMRHLKSEHKLSGSTKL